MLCKPSFDLFDSMNSFEAMHDKMDSRMHRASALTLKVARETGIIAPELTDNHRHALLCDLLAHFATWQEKNALLVQSLFSCIYLADRTLFENDEVLGPFVHALLFIINIYHRRMIYSSVIRDEDVNFPPQADHSYNPANDPILKHLELPELFGRLDKSAKEHPNFGAFIDFAKALLTITIWTMDNEEFVKI